jgi:hypothetical protein
MSKEMNRGGDARGRFPFPTVSISLSFASVSFWSAEWESSRKRLETASAETGSMRKGFFSRLVIRNLDVATVCLKNRQNV